MTISLELNDRQQVILAASVLQYACRGLPKDLQRITYYILTRKDMPKRHEEVIESCDKLIKNLTTFEAEDAYLSPEGKQECRDAAIAISIYRDMIAARREAGEQGELSTGPSGGIALRESRKGPL